MSSPFVAEIRIFGFNFAPTGWAFANGQLMPISQNTALFSLVGTFYGGDGKSTFALPDLQGSVPIGQGLSNTGTDYFLGQMSGTETVTLLTSEMPLHNHNLMGSNEDGTQGSLTDGIAIATSVGGTLYTTVTNANLANMAFQALPPAGGGLPHNNMMPYLTLNHCIAMQGVFPARG